MCVVVEAHDVYSGLSEHSTVCFWSSVFADINVHIYVLLRETMKESLSLTSHTGVLNDSKHTDIVIVRFFPSKCIFPAALSKHEKVYLSQVAQRCLQDKQLSVCM